VAGLPPEVAEAILSAASPQVLAGEARGAGLDRAAAGSRRKREWFAPQTPGFGRFNPRDPTEYEENVTGM